MKSILWKIICMLVVLTAVSTLLFANGEEEETKDPVTLKLWTIWSSDTESNKAPFLKTLAEFKAQYPDITIELDQTEASAYNTKIKTAIAANEAPDVFYYNAGGLLKSFVESGKVLPLNDYIEPDVLDRILPGCLDNMTFNGRIYGLPYTLACSVLFCNTELFNKYDVKIPETWTELMTAIKTFKKAGITPMTVGGKDRWPTCIYIDLLFMRVAGYRATHDAYYKMKNGSFTSGDMFCAAKKFEELLQAGAFPKDAVALTRDESEVPFYAGEIPMYVNGNWTAGNCQSAGSAVKDKIVAVRFPVVENGKGDINDFMGGAAEEFCVGARTKYPKEAVLLCRFIAENHSKNAYLAGAGIPTWKIDVDNSQIDPY